MLSIGPERLRAPLPLVLSSVRSEQLCRSEANEPPFLDRTFLSLCLAASGLRRTERLCRSLYRGDRSVPDPAARLMTELAVPPTTEVQPRRFTADEVQAMLEAGILHEDAPLELIDGRLVVISPVSDPHVASVNCLNRLFVEHTDPEVAVSIQNPVRIDAYNEPEPDVVLSTNLRGAPRPDDVLLLVEVSDSTLDYDRDVKTPLYARAGIPEVWIVTLEAQQVEVHRKPDGDVYRTRHLVGLGDTITPERPAAVDELEVNAFLEGLPAPEEESE